MYGRMKKLEDKDMESVSHVHLSGDERELVILDQTLLPGREEYISLVSAESMF